MKRPCTDFMKPGFRVTDDPKVANIVNAYLEIQGIDTEFNAWAWSDNGSMGIRIRQLDGTFIGDIPRRFILGY